MSAGRRGRRRHRGSLRRDHLIVCVDDEPAILDALRRSLRHEPYEVMTTADPLEALGWVETRDVSLVIMDQQMPTMGTDLLKAVRELSLHTACIMLTGRPDTRVIEGRVQGHVQRLLTKPWQDDELRRTVRVLLRELEARPERDFREDIRQLIDHAAPDASEPPGSDD